MSSLRVVVSFPAGEPVDRQSAVLDELAKAMKASMGENERLSRVPQLGLPGTSREEHIAPSPEVGLRVFLLELPDGVSPGPVLRAVGGWFMRHGALTVTLKADGPQGGASLKLNGFSTVAFARAASQINELMAKTDADG